MQTSVLFMIIIYACNRKVDVHSWQKIKRWKTSSVVTSMLVTDSRVMTSPTGREKTFFVSTMEVKPDWQIDWEIQTAFSSPTVASKCKWTALGYHRSDHYPYVILAEKSKTKMSRDKVNIFHYYNASKDTKISCCKVRAPWKLTQPP